MRLVLPRLCVDAADLHTHTHTHARTHARAHHAHLLLRQRPLRTTGARKGHPAGLFVHRASTRFSSQPACGRTPSLLARGARAWCSCVMIMNSCSRAGACRASGTIVRRSSLRTCTGLHLGHDAPQLLTAHARTRLVHARAHHDRGKHTRMRTHTAYTAPRTCTWVHVRLRSVGRWPPPIGRARSGPRPDAAAALSVRL